MSTAPVVNPVFSIVTSTIATVYYSSREVKDRQLTTWKTAPLTAIQLTMHTIENISVAKPSAKAIPLSNGTTKHVHPFALRQCHCLNAIVSIPFSQLSQCHCLNAICWNGWTEVRVWTGFRTAQGMISGQNTDHCRIPRKCEESHGYISTFKGSLLRHLRNHTDTDRRNIEWETEKR